MKSRNLIGLIAVSIRFGDENSRLSRFAYVMQKLRNQGIEIVKNTTESAAKAPNIAQKTIVSCCILRLTAIARDDEPFIRSCMLASI